MKDRYSYGVPMLVMILSVISIGVTSYYTYSSIYQPLYKATVPFGVYTLRGEIGGSLFGFSGSIEATEAYFLKYFDDMELKSKTLDASKTSIIIDGTFQLETISKRAEYKFLWIIPVKDPIHFHRHIIHIPYLPETNNTMTEDWVG